MLIRCARTTFAAVRHFSAEATAAAAKPASTGVVTSTAKTSGGRDTLGRRLLSLIYTKRSAVITIRKWKEEGRVVRKYELNRIVRELRKFRRYKHALEICEWMRIQDDIKLLPGDYAVHLDLIAKVRGLNSAEKFFEDLPDKMRGQPTCTALLHTYVQHKVSSKAETLMDKMAECGFLKYPLPYNHMLSLYISTGQLEKVPEVIQKLLANTSPDVVTYNLWLTVCASQNDVETAEKVFLGLKKAKLEPDWVTYSTLTSLYIKNSLLEKAASSLKEMEKRTSQKVRVAYSSLISLHTSMGNKDEVDRIWKKMKSSFRKMNDAEYTCMMAALVKLQKFEEAENLYTEWESVSGTRDSRVPNLLLAAHINKNKMEMAENFYSRMVQRGIILGYTTWELLTWGYLKQKQMDKVLDCFKKAISCVKKWNPDERIVREIFGSLEEQGNVDGAEQLLVTLRNAGHVNTEIYNLLLRTYAKAGKMPLLVTERMEKDKVQLDEETRELIKLTSKMCISEVSSCLS
ncbi:pentatricopeptide repeat-containing protein At4g02820, mitochondrial [Cornus florida]|uniref:pentatricopeptide repeat-containing protein At4g02820, mitochondrial n=1 Tax=Cornus florida TaxID=4283 RepID=UPI002897F270|nr:pentatricopeptide repeat-containing protein At4g02820, mitochondrial [Cornus florida]XP_059625861.1 pentatricopeptide repeat-containing protein At4g02820, mitochondrial [Cornus florida]